MNTVLNQFEVMDDIKLSSVTGGGCNWAGAAATVGVGVVGGDIKGFVKSHTWQGAVLKGIGYGIKSGVAYGATCKWT